MVQRLRSGEYEAEVLREDAPFPVIGRDFGTPNGRAPSILEHRMILNHDFETELYTYGNSLIIQIWLCG